MKRRTETNTPLVFGATVLGVLMVATVFGVTMLRTPAPTAVDRTRVSAQAEGAEMFVGSPEGEFLYSIDGDKVAINTYTRGDDGSYHGETEVRQSGVSHRYTLHVVCSPSRHWTGAAHDAPGYGLSEYTWEQYSIRKTRDERSDLIYPISAVVLLDEWQPALFETIVSLPQETIEIECLYLPLGLRTAKLHRLPRATGGMDGEVYNLSRIRVDLSNKLTAIVWFDDKHSVYVVEFPEENSRFVRRGYGQLVEETAIDDR